jgi:hypothetical protein
MKNHILLAWVRSSGHHSECVLKGHTISSSISLIFCTVVMIAPRNKAENKAALLTSLPHFSDFPSLLQQRRDGDTVTLSLAPPSTAPRSLFRSVLRWSDFTGQSLSSAANKPAFYPISSWVVRKVQSGSERLSQTTRYIQRSARLTGGSHPSCLV